MAEIKWKIPKRNEVPSSVSVPVQPSQPVTQKQNFQQPATKNIDEKAIASLIEAAKTSEEATEKITSMIMSSLDVVRFKEKLIEEALKDVQLRNKIMLELLKKL